MHAELVAHSRFFNPAFIPDDGPLADAALTPGAQAESAPHVADNRQGCGWFDSTYELQQGLTVTEDIDIDVFWRCEALATVSFAMASAARACLGAGQGSR